MARSRIIKPDFWTSEQVCSCSDMAKLLFIGLLNFCDDYGVHPASAFKLKLQIFPASPVTPKDISVYLSELINNGLIVEFGESKDKYLYVTGWNKHQKIQRPSNTTYPPPPSSYTTPIHVYEDSYTTPIQLIDDSMRTPAEEKRREEKKREEKRESSLSTLGDSVFENGEHKFVNVMEEFKDYIAPLSRFFEITSTNRWAIEMFWAWRNYGVVVADVEALIKKNETKLKDGVISKPQSLKEDVINFAKRRMNGHAYPGLMSEDEKRIAMIESAIKLSGGK